MSIGSVSAARKEIRQLAKHEEMLLNNGLTSTNHTIIHMVFYAGLL
jgi:hypothetical protein